MASRTETQLKEMASQTMTMRVILCDGDIRKLAMESRPSSMEDLISFLKIKLTLQYNFNLQFRDPEFDNELCNLTDVSELPEKPTVKIIPVLELVPISPVSIDNQNLSENLNDSLNTADTASVSTADTVLLSSPPPMMRKQWPADFSLPKFSVDVEYRLRQGNLRYLKDGTMMKVSKEMKHDILHKLAETIYSQFKAYPGRKEYEAVAKALIAAHPCLRETASQTGYCKWIQSLVDKMGNYRAKMRTLGHEDVKVNGGKRGGRLAGGDPPNKNIKKPKKGEVNYLPNFPEGHDATSLETTRQLLVDEMKKRNPDGVLINQQMDLTLSLRRKEVVTDKPPVSQVIQRWPALFVENQVYHEFNRVVGKNLKQKFYESLDRHCPQLVDIIRSKKGLKGQLLDVLLRQTKTSDIADIRCLVLRGLPILLDDNPSDFFKACFVTDDEDSYRHVTVGILCSTPEDTAEHPLKPSSLGIILEGIVVMDNLDNMTQAMCLLFGITYALHLNYPKCMANTFSFIQQVLLNIGRGTIKGKVLTLSNQLTM